MVLAFAACNKNDENPQQTENSTSADKTEITTNEVLNGSTEASTATVNEKLEGEWACDETVSPKVFYSDFYNSEITKTNIELRTIYKFNSNGTFSIGANIVNISDVRKEYRSLMVAAGRTNLEAQGKIMTTDDVLYYESYADNVLESICTALNGTYTVDGNKLIYTVNGETYYETFVISENKLTLTGSSNSDDGYPLTLTRLN